MAGRGRIWRDEKDKSHLLTYERVHIGEVTDFSTNKNRLYPFGFS